MSDRKSTWANFRLGDVIDPGDKHSFAGGPFGSDLKSEHYTTSGIRIIQLQNIGDGCFLNNEKIYTSLEKADELRRSNIYPNEIIISKMADPVARACMVPNYHQRYLMCSDGIRLSVDRRKFDTRYIYYYINSPKFRKSAVEASTGSTRQRIGLTELRNLEILAPNLAEQSKIAEILSTVDQVIELTEKEISRLEDLKRGMMNDLFTKGIGHTKFKDSPIGKIPESWVASIYSDVLEGIDAGWSPECSSEVPSCDQWGVLKVSAITGGEFNELESKLLPTNLEPRTAILVKDGDVILARANGVADLVGRCVMVRELSRKKLMLSDKTLRLRPCETKVDRHFLFYIFNSDMNRRQIENAWGGSSGQKNISQGQIKSFQLPLPPIREQSLIGKSLDSVATDILRRSEKLSRLKELKKAIMNDLLTGKVRVKV